MFNIGDYVKVYFKSGLVEAGQLIGADETNWVIRCVDESTLTIIDPLENVIAVRVFKPEEKKERLESRKVRGIFLDKDLEPTKYHRDENLRAKELAELRKLQAHEERERAREHLQNHRISSLPEVSFGTPNFNKSVYQHPAKKTRRGPR